MKKLIQFLLIAVLSSPIGAIRWVGWGGCFAQYPTLLKDINTTGETSPKGFITYNNIVYYAHNDNARGTELWRTDGTAAGTYMLKEICAGYQGSNPSGFIIFKNTLFFTAFTKNEGTELWKTDGTEAGTVLVKDIHFAANSGNPLKLTNCGDFLIFSATDSINGTEIWKSDGTMAGTSILANLTPGAGSSVVEEIVYAPSFFSAGIFFSVKNNGVAYTRIYSTSYNYVGTPTLSSPTLVVSATGTLNTNYTNSLCWYNFGLYFSNLGQRLYKYDGTNITNIKTFGGGVSAAPVTLFNGKMYFAQQSITNGTELWQSDGTTAGTVMLKDIYAGANSSNPYGFIVGNTQLYFIAIDGVGSNAVWKTDGTAAGTVKASNNNISNEKGLIAVDNDILYFQTGGTNSYFRLHKYDPVTNITTRLKDPLPTYTFYTANYGAALLGHTLIFNGYEYYSGVEVWKTDGTVAGTSMVKDVSNGSSDPLGFTLVGNNIFFAATVNVYSVPFVTDGTTAGTQALANVTYPEQDGTVAFVNVNGTVFFRANDLGNNGSELYKTDGTYAGTVLVKDINTITSNSSSVPNSLCNGNGTLFFSADDGVNGAELWKSDGTSAGTVMIKDINTGANSSSPNNLIYFNNFVYFMATDNSNNTSLWRSDGSVAGTTLIKTINTTANAFANNFTIFNNKLFFSANDVTNGNELWSSDGTTAGTNLFKDINTLGNAGSSISNLTLSASIMYFTANNGTNGVELWKTDGTVAGTVMAANISPDTFGALSSTPRNLTPVGNLLFFSANLLLDPNGPVTRGRQLWRSDGTNAGTYFVKEINPSDDSDEISPNFLGKFQTIGAYIYFPASDGSHGTELWKSDGTAAGTSMVIDLFEGYNNDGLYPTARLISNELSGQLFFEGTNGQNGRELWSFIFCPNTLNINTTVATNTQKQQASNTLTSSSNIANTDFTHDNLTVNYTAGNSITLQPGFQVNARQFSAGPAISVRETFFRADIGGCN